MEIEKRAESIMQCISSIWNTGGCIQGCDYVYIETQIKEIKREAADEARHVIMMMLQRGEQNDD
jgi:hypothetical protein